MTRQRKIIKHQNNFDFLRHAAAILVILAHAYDLNGVQSPLSRLTAGRLGEGGIAVLVFFMISGYLIPQSYLRRNNAFDYLKSRFLRIIPGIFVVTLLSVFILGPAITTFPLRDYFSETVTWKYLKNGFPINVKYQLPGVFDKNHQGVNGSLWSIPLEIRCYLGVLLLGISRLLTYRTALFVVFCFFYLGAVDALPFHVKDALYYAMFAAGALFYAFEKYISTCKAALVIAAALLIIGTYYHLWLWIFPVLGTYIILNFANRTCFPSTVLSRYGDFSYGIYIYAFPVQQLIIHCFDGRISPFVNFLIAAPLSFTCAVLSWKFVEKPALSYKNRLIRLPIPAEPQDKAAARNPGNVSL